MFSFILITLFLITLTLLIVFIQKYRKIQKKYTLLKEKKTNGDALYFKSKYASMGETVGNIAHQWKQPLNAIGSIQNSIKAALLFRGEISKEKLLGSVETSFKLVQHLAETIDTFYSFLSQHNNTNASFLVADELEKVRKITEYSFQNSNILLQFELEVNPTIRGSANEFTHAMLNIILNAKDAFDTTSVSSPKIKVRVSEGEERCIIRIGDNAGGIRLDPVDMVFDLHISTKESGSGLGLFMTKNIVENRFGGKISAANIDQGACFTIELPYAEYGERFYDIVTLDEKITLERINKLSHKVIELEEVEKVLKMWADIFKHAHWGIAIYVEASKRFEMTNSAFDSLYGYTTKEIKKMTLGDFFTPETLPFFLVVQEEAFKQGYAVLEAMHKRKDGTTFPVSIELIVVKDDAGKILYYIANIWDLTQRKMAEQRLLLKKFALNHINESVFLIDENSKFHYINESASNNLGYTKEELLDMGVIDIDPNISAQIWNEHWQDIKKHKTTLMISEHRRKNGTTFPIEVSSNYFKYEGIGYSLAISRDISERKVAEEKLLLVNTAINSTSEAIYIMDEELSIIYVNDGASNMLGYTKEELTSMKVYDIDVNFPKEEIFKIREKVIDTQQIVFNTKHRKKSGEIVDVEILGSSFIFNNKPVELAVVKDITVRKKFEEQLKLLETAINNASDAVYIVDDDRAIKYVSDAACRMLGYSVEEFLDMRVEDIDPHMTVDEIDKVKEKVNITDSTSFKTKHRTKNAKTLDVEITVTKFIFNDTNLRLSIVKDMTQQIRYEEEIIELNRTLEQKVIERTQELQKALEFNKSIIQTIPDMLFEISKEGVYLNIWASDEKLLAAQKEILLGKNFQDILPPEAVEISFKTMKEVDMYGSSLGNSYKLDFPDGEHWFELHTTKKEPGNTYLALVRDITERKQAQLALVELNSTLEEKVRERTFELQKSLEFTQEIINTLPDLLFEIDIKGNYLNVWARDEKLLAQQKNLLLGHTVHEVLSKKSADTIFEALREADTSGFSSGKTIEIQLAHGLKSFELSVSKKVSSNTFLVLSRDITKRDNIYVGDI